MESRFLSDLGIERDITYETIITTLAPDGAFNAAPMGLKTLDGNTLTINPFRVTQTYRNLITTRTAVANFTDNPKMFFITAFKDERPCLKEMFTEAKVAKAPRLINVESIIELRVDKVRESLEKATVECYPIYSEIVHTPPKPYCRAKFAVIEAIIHATRIKVFIEEGRREEVEPLTQLVHAYRTLVSRVSPDSAYSSLMDQILTLVNEWQNPLRS